MVRSRIFGFVTITVCLVACMCAHADVSYGEVLQLAIKAEDMSTTLLKRAKDNAKSALDTLESIKSYKESSEQAVHEAKKKSMGNREAESLYNKAKKALDDIVEEYAKVIASAQNNVKQTNKTLEKAKKLRYKSQHDIWNATHTFGNYTNNKKLALEVIGELIILDEEITAAPVSYEVTQSAEKRMSSHAKTVELAKYQIDGIVAFGKIENMLKDAETGIQQTQRKKNNVKVISTAIKKLEEQTPADLTSFIGSLYTSAENVFTSASSSAEDMQKKQKEIRELKKETNNMIERIKAETDVNETKKLMEGYEGYADKASQQFSKIKGTLEVATQYATNAHSLYENAATELKKKGISVKKLILDILPVDDAAESPAVIANTMYVSVQLILALIACVSVY